MPGVVAQYIQDHAEQAAQDELYWLMRERYSPEDVSRRMNEMIQHSPAIKSPEMLDQYLRHQRTGPVAQYLQDRDSDGREEQEHHADLASDRTVEQWQRDQLSHLSTPELHDRWVSAVREFWAESETLDFRNGSPIAADRAADLEAHAKLIYAEMNKPERVAELHELEQAPPWIEQGLSY